MRAPAPAPPRPAGRLAHGIIAAAACAWLVWAEAAFSGRGFPGLAWLVALAAALALTVGGAALGGAADRGSPLRRWVARFVGAGLGTVALWATGLAAGPTPGWTWATAAWLAVVATLITAGVNRLLRGGPTAALPSTRVLPALALATLSLVAFRSLYFAGEFGAGDAYWYRIMLADYVTQVRAGIFPVWIGQSIYAFNGATAPLRVAPLFQHQGGLVDLLTGRTLPPGTLCNLVLALNALGLAASVFTCLRPILPGRDWIRAWIAAMVVLSPAIFAPPYTGDQYMTFVALPWVPLVLLGMWRLGRADRARGLCEIAIGLALLWWAHAPIAMWSTFAAAGAWAWHRLPRWRQAATWRELPIPALLFLALGAYPFVSAVSLDNVLDVGPAAQDILPMLDQAFPGNFLPVDFRPGLSHYQTGYPLLLLGLLALAARFLRPPRRPTACELWCIAIPLLVLPIPYLAPLLWSLLPEVVLRVNNAWPMQRLMPLWALALAWIAAAAWPPLRRRPTQTRLKRWSGLALLGLVGLIGLGWSALEAQKFTVAIDRSKKASRGVPVEQLPQNIQLTRYSYAAFSRFPTTFSHGFTDPYLEQRLLSRDQSRVLVDNAAAVRALPQFAAGEFMAVNDNNSTFYNLNPRLHLDPDRRYALVFDWLVEPETAHLQIFGDRLKREYLLPASGVHPLHESRAFGQGPLASRTVSLRTDAPAGTTPRMIYIAPQRPVTPAFPLARFSLHEVDPTRLPVRVHSWLPYESSAFTPEPAWLETPKMWITGYRATVNGRPVAVARSPDDLVLIPLDVGPNDIRLVFQPAWPVWCAYFSALFTLLGLAGWAARRMLRGRTVLASSPAEDSPRDFR